MPRPDCDRGRTRTTATRRSPGSDSRGEVIPLLDDVLGGGVVSALGRTADLLTDDLDALDDLAVAVAGAALAADGSLVVASLVDHPAAVRRRVLRTWAGHAPGTTPPDSTALPDIPLPDANVFPDATAPPDAALPASGRSQGTGPASRRLTADHLYRLDALLTDGRSGQAVRLPGGADVVRRRGRLTLADPAPGDPPARSG